MVCGVWALKSNYFSGDIFHFSVLIVKDSYTMGDFKKLDIWKLSHEVVILIYKIIDLKDFRRDFDLISQIRRAAISIPSNIAEGEESGFNKLGIRYFFNAKASTAELRAQLLIARDINYISNTDFAVIDKKLDIISMKIRKLIEYRQQKT